MCNAPLMPTATSATVSTPAGNDLEWIQREYGVEGLEEFTELQSIAP